MGYMGALLNYLHHRQLSFDDKDESYPGVIARDSGGFHLRTQLNDALLESYAIPSKPRHPNCHIFLLSYAHQGRVSGENDLLTTTYLPPEIPLTTTEFWGLLPACYHFDCAYEEKSRLKQEGSGFSLVKQAPRLALFAMATPQQLKIDNS